MKNASLTDNQPPTVASKLLSWALPQYLVEPVLGDLSEEYLQRAANNQLLKAKLWYWRQAVKSAMQFMLKTQGGFVMFIVSIILFLGLTYMAMDIAGGVSMYVDIPSVLLIFPPAIAFACAATSINQVKSALSVLMVADASKQPQVYRSCKRVFSVLGNAGILLGVLMTLIGWVAIGAMADDVSMIGPAFSVSILTLVYGLALKILCYVAEQKIQTLSENENY